MTEPRRAPPIPALAVDGSNPHQVYPADNVYPSSRKLPIRRVDTFPNGMSASFIDINSEDAPPFRARDPGSEQGVHLLAQSVGGVPVNQLQSHQLQSHRQQNPIEVPRQRPNNMGYGNNAWATPLPRSRPPSQGNSPYEESSVSPIFDADDDNSPPYHNQQQQSHFPVNSRQDYTNQPIVSAPSYQPSAQPNQPIMPAPSYQDPVYQNLSRGYVPKPRGNTGLPPPILEVVRHDTPPLPPRQRPIYDYPRCQPLPVKQDVQRPPPLPPKPLPKPANPPSSTVNGKRSSPRRGDRIGTEHYKSFHSNSSASAGTKVRSKSVADVDVVVTPLRFSGPVLDGIGDNFRDFIDGKDSRSRDTNEKVPLDPNLICPFCTKQFRMDETLKCGAHVRLCHKEDKLTDDEFESGLDGADSRNRKTNELVPFDPNLTCPVCQHQFRFNETTKCRVHVKKCVRSSETRIQEWVSVYNTVFPC